MMSEVKTRKQEALELLALLDNGDELTWDESERLTYITIEQGYPIFQQHPDELEKYREADPIHWYHIHVDKCLTLPLSDGYRWVVVSPTAGSEYLVAWALITTASTALPANMHRGASLPIAMLKAWWSIQPDDHPA